MSERLWRTVAVRTALIKKIESYLEVDNTITNITQFTDLALRDKLDNIKKNKEVKP